MNSIQYISNDYVPRVDLETLGRTYNTLEEGHQSAIKAASELEATIANMPMNEAEDGFKQQLINEIRTTVDNNTLYGNSYAALDNIVEKVGNIQSDGRVIGRIRNQQAKKEYDAKVDAMAIPDGMKQMYKEENPYYYNEGSFDVRTGRVLPGELWEAKSNPVTTVPQSEIQKYALQIAAKEAGSGDSISFLDVNGKETYDPSQSADGVFYRKVGTKYERLSEDKIRQAYKVAIDSIPGARDSLNQDYKYETWQYDKLVKDAEEKGGDTTPYVPGYTDKNGNIYTEEQWLNNKINNFADVAAYNHVYTNVDYGTALQNRKASLAAYGSGTGNNLYDTGNRLGQIISGTEEVESNSFAGATKAKHNANSIGLNLAKKFAGDLFKTADSITDIITTVRQKDSSVRGPGGAANYIIRNYGKNMTPTQKSQLINSFTGYVQANKQYNQLLKSAGKDSDALRFSYNIASEDYTNDNEYGRKIINWLNGYYKYNKEAKFTVGNQVLTNLTSLYKTDIDGLRNLGFNIVNNNDNTYDVSIDANHRNLLPKFASYIRKADDSVPGTPWSYLKKTLFNEASDVNYVEHGIGGFNADTMSSSSPFGGLAKLYDKGDEAASKAESKVGVAKGTRSFSSANYGSFGAAYGVMNPQIAEQRGETLSQFIDRQNEQVDLAFAQGNFDSGQIQFLDKSGRASIDISKNQDAKTLIQNMYADDTQKKKIKRAIKIPTGTEAGGTQGYILSFTVPKDFGNSSFKEGEKVNMVISGVSQEEINFNPFTNPDVLASNAVVLSRATGGNIEVQGYDSDLGYTDLSLITKGKDKGKYNSSFMGHNNIISAEEAENYATVMFTLQQFKNQLYGGAYNLNNPIDAQLANNKFETIVTEISNITGIDANSVRTAVQNSLSKRD